MCLRVCYDYQILATQKYGGISRYFYEIASRIMNLADVKISCLFNRNYYFRDMLPIYAPKNFMSSFIERKLSGTLNRLHSLHVMKGCDILHPTYYKPYMLGRFSGKIILTVHDLINEIYGVNPEETHNKHRMLHAAAHVIAISENTKNDILRIFPDISPEKISVIYHGSSMQTPTSAGENPLGRPYVLFVGARWSYKNFVRFVMAMRPILERHGDLKVLCAGGGEFSADEFALMGEMSSRYVQRNMNDDELAQAYANAECFVFPSEYEGFGIPVLESFACECPLVCSNASSLPEVANNATEYFDPFNVDDMSAAIMRVIEDESLRERLRASGRERIKLFSWDDTARRTLECYRKVLEA